MRTNRPFTKSTSTALATGPFGNNVADALWLAGAWMVTLISSGATAITTPTAAQLYNASGFDGPSESYRLRIVNTNAGTLTITPDASIAGSGTMTIAANTWREFDIKFTSPAAATMVSVGTGTNS